MAYRHHKTKKLALENIRKVTPESFGAPRSKLLKRVYKTKKGWTSLVTIRRK